MAFRKAVFLHCPELEQFTYPAECPFNTSRAGQVRKIVESMGLLSGPNVSEVAPEAADRITLKKFHTARYLRVLKNADEGKFEPEALYMGIGSPDCPIFPGMYGYSAFACGASSKGAELILSGKADAAFNPSGGLHHAGPEKASGFCYMNDVALACTVLAEAPKRVLYVDVDVHHGDGVQDAFYERCDVMTISLHQTGRTLFPGSGFEDEIGSGEGRGYCVNVPLPIGTYDEIYLKAFKAIVLPLAKKFNSDVIVLQLGGDALSGDPLAHLRLTNNTHVAIINSLLKFNKPILMTGGGGYNIPNTVRMWTLAWSVLSGSDTDEQARAGLGGVMLETTDWQGGLRDRELPVAKQQRAAVAPVVEATIERVKRNVFTLHGL